MLTNPARKSLAAIFGGLFLVTAWAALRSDGMFGLELDLFRFFYDASDRLWLLALVVTQLGSAWVLLGVVGVLFVTKWRPEPALVVLRAGMLAYVLSVCVKFAVGRPRPALFIDDISVRELIVRGSGFPSTHVAIAAAVGLSLLPYVPKPWRWLPVLGIVLVAWSRLYLGVHTPLDALGGFLLGAFIALVAVYIPWWGVEKRRKR